VIFATLCINKAITRNPKVFRGEAASPLSVADPLIAAAYVQRYLPDGSIVDSILIIVTWADPTQRPNGMSIESTVC